MPLLLRSMLLYGPGSYRRVLCIALLGRGRYCVCCCRTRAVADHSLYLSPVNTSPASQPAMTEGWAHRRGRGRLHPGHRPQPLDSSCRGTIRWWGPVRVAQATVNCNCVRGMGARGESGRGRARKAWRAHLLHPWTTGPAAAAIDGARDQEAMDLQASSGRAGRGGVCDS